MPEEPSQREILWRDYALSADLYKFYVESSEGNVFYYAITGAIVSSCCFAQQQIAYTKWALLLPALMSVSLAVLCRATSRLLCNLSSGRRLRTIQLWLAN